MDFSTEDVNRLDSLKIVYFVDEDAFIKIGTGGDELHSWYGDWGAVMKVTNTLFEKTLFTRETRWLEAGCLFVSLCIRRAELEQSEGPFRTASGAEVLGIERVGSIFDDLLTPVHACDYLGFARRCFNSGLRFPRGVRIAPVTWMECHRDMQICISEAEKMRKDGISLYASVSQDVSDDDDSVDYLQCATETATGKMREYGK